MAQSRVAIPRPAEVSAAGVSLLHILPDPGEPIKRCLGVISKFLF
jgi:hypothetical protein